MSRDAESERASSGLSKLLTLDEMDAEAGQRMSRMAYDYVASGAADELTLRWNAERWRSLRLRPRLFSDVSRLDVSVEMFGHRHSWPLLLAPAANQRLLHPEAELATARGAALGETAMVLSNAANVDIHEVAGVAPRPLWFQLYIQPDEGLTRDIVQYAEDAGADVLCVTVDSPVEGVRNREKRAAMCLPPGTEHPNYLGRRTGPRSVMTLDEVRPQRLDAPLMAWLCSISRRPVVFKGILTPEDAERAIGLGAAGIIVSNHGGRALDTTPASVDALPAVVDRVAGRVPVLVDGGIRRGTDLLKALALGATAGLIGRPYLYGLALGGAEGVAHAIKILRMEFLAALALSGRANLTEIDRSLLW